MVGGFEIEMMCWFGERVCVLRLCTCFSGSVGKIRIKWQEFFGLLMNISLQLGAGEKVFVWAHEPSGVAVSELSVPAETGRGGIGCSAGWEREW